MSKKSRIYFNNRKSQTAFLGLIMAGMIFSSCGNESSKPAKENNRTGSAQELKNSPSPAPETPELTAEDLRRASLSGRLKTIREAVKNGVDINAADEGGRTALMLAAYNGHTDAVRFLLENGADIGSTNTEGRTALIFAASGPFPETVGLLLEWDADPNKADDVEGWSALMFAASGGHLDVVKVLVKNGADVTLKDKEGETALDFAKQHNHTEVVKLLEKAQKKE